MTKKNNKKIKIGKKCILGENIIFLGNVTIGNNCKVGNNVVLGFCSIGNNTVIEDNSIIGYDTITGHYEDRIEFLNKKHDTNCYLGTWAYVPMAVLFFVPLLHFRKGCIRNFASADSRAPVSMPHRINLCLKPVSGTEILFTTCYVHNSIIFITFLSFKNCVYTRILRGIRFRCQIDRSDTFFVKCVLGFAACAKSKMTKTH